MSTRTSAPDRAPSPAADDQSCDHLGGTGRHDQEHRPPILASSKVRLRCGGPPPPTTASARSGRSKAPVTRDFTSPRCHGFPPPVMQFLMQLGRQRGTSGDSSRHGTSLFSVPESHSRHCETRGNTVVSRCTSVADHLIWALRQSWCSDFGRLAEREGQKRPVFGVTPERDRTCGRTAVVARKSRR